MHFLLFIYVRIKDVDEMAAKGTGNCIDKPVASAPPPLMNIRTQATTQVAFC